MCRLERGGISGGLGDGYFFDLTAEKYTHYRSCSSVFVEVIVIQALLKYLCYIPMCNYCNMAPNTSAYLFHNAVVSGII